MAVSDVFPQSKLNPDAVPWGRSMEALARKNAYDLENVRLAVHGDNRSSAGQMGVVGRNIDGIALQQSEIQAQVTELGLRSSGSVVRANLSVNAASTTVFASATGTQVVPGDGADTRQNIISFVANITYSAPAIGTSTFVRVFQGSNTLLTVRHQNGGVLPSGWTEQVMGTFVYPVDAAGTTFSIQLQAVNFQTGTQTITLVAPTFNYVRADKV